MSKLRVNQQVGWSAFNRFSDPDNVQKRDIPLTTFNLAQVRTINASMVGQGLEQSGVVGQGFGRKYDQSLRDY